MLWRMTTIAPAAEQETQPAEWPVRYSRPAPPLGPGVRDPGGCLVVVARSSSLTKVRRTMFDVERRFNVRFGYPYVVLGEDELPAGFRAAVAAMAAGGGARFGRVPAGDWGARMARYWAAPFADHPALAQCRYAWRLEPGSHHTCDVEHDPIAAMRRDALAYAFAVAHAPAGEPALPLVQPHGSNRSSAAWLRAPATARCRVLASSELVDLDFVRSPAYRALFAAADRAGAFAAGWTDASVRTLAVATLLDRQRVRWLADLGYSHGSLHNCPAAPHRQMRCHCDPRSSTHLVSRCAEFWS
ncbi:hypothetical protein H4R18_005941 [Coemansia javaensis]|uniref:Uncharacterized protein n=1 Tax=Coemansia javaensis TaxID=2761396 RepID=A0A9W8H4X9_9FUNG|nr:hypothetical protein H4R18_005941 [Coemansia javaensis]